MRYFLKTLRKEYYEPGTMKWVFVVLCAFLIIGPNLPFVDNVEFRFTIICMLASLILAFLFDIHEIITEEEKRRTFEDFTLASETYSRILNSAIANNPPLRVKMLGVALKYSWEPTKKSLESYYKTHGRFPSNLELDIAIISPEWLEGNLEVDDIWKKRSDLFHCEFIEFLNKYKDNILLNEKPINEQAQVNSSAAFKISLHKYSYTPNHHGILIESSRPDASKKDLFLSHCAWIRGKLCVGENKYIWHNDRDSMPEEFSFYIEQYNQWFSFNNAEYSYIEFSERVKQSRGLLEGGDGI